MRMEHEMRLLKNVPPPQRLMVGMILCFLVTALWFSPWWANGKNLAPLNILNEMMQPWRGKNEQVEVKNHFVADGVTQYLIYRLKAERDFREEGHVGWNSLSYGGTAQHANTMALYDDWSMQLHRCLPFWTAWHVGLWAQVLIAAWGMLFFLSGRGIGMIWGVGGALIYAANSQFVTWINHRWALGCFCWVPWMLWAVDLAWRGKRWARAAVAVFLAMALLGGTLQHGVIAGLVLVASWFEQWCQQSRAQRWQLTGTYIVWALLAAGMAAAMLLPCAVAYVESSRLGLHTTAAMGVYPQGWSQPLFLILSTMGQWFPSIFGSADTLDLLKLFRSEYFYVAYFGSLPVIVAFLGLWRRDVPRLAKVLMLIGLVLPLTPALKYLYQRLYLLFIFGGIYAFSHHMTFASRDQLRTLWRWFMRGWVVLVLVWGVLSLVLQWNVVACQQWVVQRILPTTKGSAFGYFQDWWAQRIGRFVENLIIWNAHQGWPMLLLMLGLIGWFLLAWGKSLKSVRCGALLMVCAMVGEVTLFAHRWVTFVDPQCSPLYPVNADVAAVMQHVGHDGRVVVAEKLGAGHMAITPFIPNTLMPYGIATIGGYDSIVPEGMNLLVDWRSDAERCAHYGVTHWLSYPGNQPIGAGWRLVWQGEGCDLYENQHALPKYLGFSSSSACEQMVKKGALADQVALRERLQLENRREIELGSDVRWVRIAENQASGWQYRPKSASADAWRNVMRGEDRSMVLDVSAPEFRQAGAVEMRYEPPLRHNGAWVAGCCFVVNLGWLLWRPRRAKALMES